MLPLPRYPKTSGAVVGTVRYVRAFTVILETPPLRMCPVIVDPRN